MCSSYLVPPVPLMLLYLAGTAPYLSIKAGHGSCETPEVREDFGSGKPSHKP
jgi:hypothetical protein